MRENLKKILAYITRSWEDKPGYTHPRLRILPPIVIELSLLSTNSDSLQVIKIAVSLYRFMTAVNSQF